MPSILKKLLSNNPLQQMADTDRKVLSVCIGAALVFWLILNLSRDYDINRRVIVDYIVDPERVLVGRMPSQLDATVSGNGWNLIWESLRPGDLSASIDLRNREDNPRLSATDLKRQLSRKLSSNKLTISLPGFESISILTTPKEGKRVPVLNRVVPSFAKGHQALDQATILPDSVTISGATDALEEISEWPTESLELKDLSRGVSRVVNLEVPPEGITLSRPEVSYSLEVEAFIQDVITVPVSLENVPDDKKYEYSPKTIDLKISLPQSAYATLRAEDFKVVADLSGLSAGASDNSVPITILRKPPQVVSERFSPRVVTYYIVD